MSDYLAELRRLAATCSFGAFLEEALCDRYVYGLCTEAVQQRLWVEAELTLSKS